jgi:CHAT domain-containing protein
MASQIPQARLRLSCASRLTRRCLLLIFSLQLILPGFPAGESLRALPVVNAQEQTASANRRQEEAEAPSALSPGKVIEREMGGAQSHVYQLNIAAGQFVKIIIEQIGMDSVIKISGPDNNLMSEVNSPKELDGVETVWLVAETSGTYRLEIQPVNEETAEGKYRARISEMRAATEEERSLFKTALSLTGVWREADRLLKERTVDSRYAAIKKLEEALPLYASLNDRSAEVRVLYRLGITYSYLGDKQKALDYYNRVLALKRADADRMGEASMLADIGTVHSSLGQLARALDYYGQALRLYRELRAAKSEALMLRKTALAYSSLGDMQKAHELYNEALALSEAGNDHAGVAEALDDLATFFYLMGDARKALDYNKQALALFRSLRKTFNEAVILNKIGLIYRSRDEWAKALGYYERSLALWPALRQKTREAYLREASTLCYIGEVKSATGDRQGALGYFKQALAIRRTFADKRRVAWTLDIIGATYAAQGEIERALENYHQAIELYEASGARASIARTLNLTGMAYSSAGQAGKALEQYNRALSFWREAGDRYDEAPTLLLIARAERQAGDLEGARRRIEEALSIIENTRAQIVSQELRASYFSTVQQYYEFYIDLLWQLHKQYPSRGYDAEALTLSELARARSLVELLQESRAEIREGIDPLLLQKSVSLKRQMDALVRRQAALLGGENAPAQAADSIVRELAAVMKLYEETQAQIGRESPRYAALTQPQPLSLKEIQSRVLDSETMLLEYKLGEDRSYAWAVTAGSIKAFELPGRAEVEGLARQVYELLTARNRRPDPNQTLAERSLRWREQDSLYRQQAARLSHMLLGPVAGELGSKRLVVVAEGALQYIPFGALPAPAARPPTEEAQKLPSAEGSFVPLIVEHEIISLPSASVLAVLREETRGRERAPKAVAVFADPVFERDDPRIKPAAQKARAQAARQTPAAAAGRGHALQIESEDEAKSFPRLLSTREEAMRILAMAPAEQFMSAFDFDASRATATDARLAQYRILHFATHGLLNSERPELSGIILSLVNKEGTAQDGYLRLYEIYNLKLPAELVVLSACNTALGKEVRGEGLVGLTRGFMYAGAQRVVASLWKVDDEATAELMRRFYEKMLKEGVRPSAALRAAQVEMWQQKRWNSPYFWSAFTIQGEWR